MSCPTEHFVVNGHRVVRIADQRAVAHAECKPFPRKNLTGFETTQSMLQADVDASTIRELSCCNSGSPDTNYAWGWDGKHIRIDKEHQP
jgi:hypothetical protein